MPRYLTRAFFYSKLPYAITDDLFFIWAVSHFGSLSLVGWFVAIQVVLQLATNHLIGRISDSSGVRIFSRIGIGIAVVLWCLTPAITAQWQAAIALAVMNIALIPATLPFERTYHNAARASDHPVEFAIWREVCIQSALVVGCLGLLMLLPCVSDWRLLFPLGAISALALLLVPAETRTVPPPLPA